MDSFGRRADFKESCNSMKDVSEDNQISLKITQFSKKRLTSKYACVKVSCYSKTSPKAILGSRYCIAIKFMENVTLRKSMETLQTLRKPSSLSVDFFVIVIDINISVYPECYVTIVSVSLTPTMAGCGLLQDFFLTCQMIK